jgi:hypothetical protein
MEIIFARLDFSVQHVKGKENVVADALSRCCIMVLVE